MSGERCVMVGGIMWRVTKDFDETPGSEDMRGLEQLAAHFKSTVQSREEKASDE